MRDLAMKLGAVLVGAVASLGFVAFVGAMILWSRFEAAELPADQAVAVQPREDLITVGGIALVVFVLGGLLAVLLLKLLLEKDENDDDDDKNELKVAATLRTRNGLIVVMLLEIIAAFVFEQWDTAWSLVPLVVVVLLGLAAIAGFLELAARSLPRHPKNPLWRFLKRAYEIFFTGVTDVSRTRLWIGVVLLAAGVAVIAAGEPGLLRYGIALALGVAGCATVMRLRLRAQSEAERTWALLVVCLAVVATAGAVLGRESPWVALVALIALAFLGVNIAVAHISDHFLAYGATVFATIALFGTAFSLVRALEDPQAQGLAFLRTNDTTPVCGLYVTETDERLYYGRVDLKGTGNVRDLRKNSGRLFWVPRERLDAAEIGPLESVEAAQGTALDLRKEIALNREPLKRGDKLPAPAEAAPAPSATGADPCGPQPTNVEQPLTPERELAERFQPRVLMSSNDGFWPVSLLTIFKLQRRGRVLCREPGCVPVRSEADLPFVGGETQWLEYPADFNSTEQQRRSVIRALRSANPYRTAREYFLKTKGDNDTTTLQYWFFYPFNYQPLRAPGLKAGFHEGDFEHVDVLLSRDGEPRMVWMARHDDEGQPFLWNESALKRRKDHVDVYPARGSHASYESCLRQPRPKAPFGLINDRPECKETKQFVFEPGQVPLSDLTRTRWACWGGNFGHVGGSTSKEWRLVEADAPRSPLWQQRASKTDEGDRPCDGLTLPQTPISGGEEPLGGDIAEQIAQRADRLDPVLDKCEDWWRPQPQGAYLAACEPAGLADWMKDGLGAEPEPRLRVLARPRERADGEAWPLAVRRDASAPTFRQWRILAEQKATIRVYATCLARQRPIEATFAEREIQPGHELSVDDRADGTWRLMDGSRVLAEATPRTPGEAKDGPNARVRPPPSTVCSQ